MGDVPSSRVSLYFVATQNTIAKMYEIDNYFVFVLYKLHNFKINLKKQFSKKHPRRLILLWTHNSNYFSVVHIPQPHPDG